MVICIALAGNSLFANIHESFKNKTAPAIQASATPLRQGSINNLSNIQFWEENFGEMYYDLSNTGNNEGTWWPRGYTFNYVFGGGFWFGFVERDTQRVLVGYNPYNGGSSLQPGSVHSAQMLYDSVMKATGTGRYPSNLDADYTSKFTIYYSTEYDKNSGKPLNPALNLPPWPIWDTDPDTTHFVGVNRYFGNYVDSIALRDTLVYKPRYITKYDSTYDSTAAKYIKDSTVFKKGGPAFVSEEDIFTICNNLDTSVYNQTTYPGNSYPHIESQRMIYSWGSQANANYIFVVYKTINKDNIRLDSCWLAPDIDFDIGTPTTNECGYYNKDTTLNLGMGWAYQQANVPLASNQTLAYPGVEGWDFLQSPTLYKTGDQLVDSNGAPTGQTVPDTLVGSIKPGVYPPSQQLGLKTFHRWAITNDPTSDPTRYAFMTAGTRDTAPFPNQYSDKRMLMATGPFTMFPGQTAQVVYGLMITRDSANGDNELDSSINDCVALCRRAQQVYDSNFQVPVPPNEPSFRTVTPLSNGVYLSWDSSAEYSYDPIGAGLDFLGYNLYRGKQDQIGQNGTRFYDQYKNPFGYQLIQSWSLAQLDSNTFKIIQDSMPAHNASATIRQAFYKNYIAKYMDSLTNHHSFYDWGFTSGNNTGNVTPQQLLYDDVDYYYWIAAFNQGSATVHVPSQMTNGKIGQSKIVVHPVSSYAGVNSTFQILSPQGELGGITDFRWSIINQDIVNQLLANDTLSVTFNQNLYTVAGNSYLYGLNMNVFDKDTARHVSVTYPYSNIYFPGIIAAGYQTGEIFFASLADTGYPTFLHLATGADPSLNDTTTAIQVAGLLPMSDTDFTPNQNILNAMSHLFNYNFYEPLSWHSLDSLYLDKSGRKIDTVWQKPQFLIDLYNLDTADVEIDSPYHFHVNMNRAFGIMQGSADVSIYWDNTGGHFFDSSANAGQYDYLVQFTGSGDTTITANKETFTVPYLTLQITGEQVYHVQTVNNQDSAIKISYILNPTSNTTLEAGQWRMFPNSWILTPSANDDAHRFQEHKGAGEILGTAPNKYFLTAQTAQNDTTSLAFTNLLHVGGQVIFLDSLLKGDYTSDVPKDTGHVTYRGINLQTATHDFKVGDIVRISYKGGILGLPTPGASFETVFTPSVPQPDSSSVTSSELSNVHVWPNPYIIGNSVDPNAPGLQTPALGNELVFNHLPPRCTIRIFNIVGDLIRTIDHTTGSEEHWNLLSDGGQLSGSQMVVAEVEAPNGAKAMLDIAIIAYGK